MTHIIGNDETHLTGKLTAFAGFRSFDDMLDYIERLPRPSSAGNRDAGWQTGSGRDSFTKSSDMRHALRIARNGWAEGADMVRRIAELITTEHAVNRQRVYSVAGGRANVARMLAGNPSHMRSRPKRDARKVVTLYVELTASAAIDAENLMIRAATIAAVCDILEQAEHSCNIVAVETSRDREGRSFQIAVEVKSAGEAMNIDNMTFALGHPSMLRRFCFALASVPDELRGFWFGMGRPEHTFKRGEEPPGSYYFSMLSLNDQGKVTGATVEQRAMSLIPLVMPYNLSLGATHD